MSPAFQIFGVGIYGKRSIPHDERSAALIRDVSFDLVIKSSRLLHKARKLVKEVEGQGRI